MQIGHWVSVRTTGVLAAVIGFTGPVAHSAPDLMTCHDLEIEQVRSFLNDAEISLAEAIAQAEQQCKGRAIHAELIDEDEHGTGASNGVRSRHYHVCCLASCEISYLYVDSHSGMVRATHEMAPPPTDSRPESVEPVEQSTVLRASAAGYAPETLAHPFRVQLASELIGMSVEDNQGEKFGEVRDFAIDPARGRVAYAVLSVGDFKGKEDQWFAVPMDAMTFPNHGAYFVVAVEKDRLQGAPCIDKERWPELTDASWENEIHEIYGTRPYWMDEVDGSAPEEMCIQKASEIIYCTLQSASDETLGKIEDLAIDPDRARIVYAVLSLGSHSANDDKLFAIPAGAVQMPAGGGYAVLTVNRDRLQSANGFDKNNWPNLADPTYYVDTYAHYGQELGWMGDSWTKESQ